MAFFDISKFLASFDGGARSYLFLCNIGNDNYKYYVRSTSLPDTSVDELVLTWRLFDFKVGTKRIYSDWTVTFNSDKDYKIRMYFENQINLIANRTDYGSPKDYMKNIELWLLGTENLSIKSTPKVETYKPYKKLTLIDAWPKSIGPITLDYSSSDIAQFDVTFSFNYYTLEDVA